MGRVFLTRPNKFLGLQMGVQVLLHNRCPMRRSQDNAGKTPSPCPVRQEYFPLYSPNFTRHEFSRNLSHAVVSIAAFLNRKSTLTNNAPMRLSDVRKDSESYCRRHFHDCGWQSEMKRRASSVVGCGPQTATMRFHDGTADRQPHAAALRFRGEEGIEYLVCCSGRQSYSGVAD